MARTFEAEVRAALAGRRRRTAPARAAGFFACGRRRARRGLPRAARDPTVDAQPRCAPRDAPNAGSRIVTGEYRRARCSSRSLDARELPGPTCGCCRSTNRFFGGNIGVTGLLTGADVAARARRASPTATAYLLPDVVLSRGRFLDGTTVADLPRPVEVVADRRRVARRARSGRDAA